MQLGVEVQEAQHVRAVEQPHDVSILNDRAPG
jgi:hypothetical protein